LIKSRPLHGPIAAYRGRAREHKCVSLETFSAVAAARVNPKGVHFIDPNGSDHRTIIPHREVSENDNRFLVLNQRALPFSLRELVSAGIN